MDGQAVSVDSAGRFSAEVDLSGAPLGLAAVVATNQAGDTFHAQAQLAEAGAGTGEAPSGQQAEIGRAGGDALAGLAPTFATAADFEPAAGLELASDTCTPCVVGIECADTTEVLAATGAASVQMQAALDPSSGQLDLDLAATEISWGIEIRHTGHYSGTQTGSLDLRLGAATGTGAALGCQGLGLDLSMATAPRSWSFDGTTYCADATTVGEATVWPDHGQPGLAATTCAWGAWLEAAFATDLQAISLEADATADRDGVHVRWRGVSDEGTPPQQAPERASPIPPDGIDLALADNLLGIAFDIATRTAAPVTVTDSGLTLEISTPHPDSAALAAVSPAGGRALVVPFSYRLSNSGGPCESGHIVPGISDLSVTSDGDTWVMAVEDIDAAGADRSSACGLSEDARGALFAEAFEELIGDVSVRWSAAEGLTDRGATLTWGAAAAAYTVGVTL